MVITFHGVTLGVSEYDIPALDVALVDGAVQFLTEDGMVSLDGDLDAESHIETGDLGLAPGSVCNVPRAYLVLHAGENLRLRATVGQGGERVAEYPVPARSGDGERARTVPMGKGPRGNDWRFRLRAAAGDWRLKGLEIRVDRVGRAR